MQLLAGRPTVEDPDAFLQRLRENATDGVAVQAFDARYVAGAAHLERAARLARRERSRGNPIADSLAVEVLCYAAGRRQIEAALEMGVSGTTDGVVVAVLDDRESGAAGSERGSVAPTSASLQDAFELAPVETDDAARDILAAIDRERLESYFEVSADELGAAEATLAELVAERVALLVVER